jgi:hypothetical protein
MRDALAYNQQNAPVTWPHYTCQPSAVYLVDAAVPATDLPGRKVRRALQRAVTLLRDGGGQGGLPDADRLVEWLRAGPDTMLGRKPYPFPKRVAIRCQFETQARFMAAAVRIVPARKRAALREVAHLAGAAATSLLRTEPARAFSRADAVRSGEPRSPWGPGAWDRQAADLVASAEAREREIALVQDLRDRVARMADALESIATE